MSKLHMTDVVVSRLQQPGTYWDEVTPGFGLRVGKKRKTWIVMRGEIRQSPVQSLFAVLLVASIGLFIFAKIKAHEVAKLETTDTQRITLRQMLNQPTFMLHAYSMLQAQEFEEQVRGDMTNVASILRASAAVGETNTYEL